MEYLLTQARFLFFNGLERYTVEYAFGLSKWFVFKNDERTNAIHVKEDKKTKLNKVNKEAAESILDEYLVTKHKFQDSLL